MIEDTSPTVIGTIIVSFSLASRPNFSTYCSATRNCTALYPAGVSTAFGRLANALGRGPLHDRDGGGPAAQPR